jgi:hypothetical protein
VIIFPDNSEYWSGPNNRFIKSARTGADGRFTIDQPLPPTDYLAVAVEVLEPGEWAEPDNLERLRPLAARFTITDGEQKVVTLHLPRAREREPLP